MRPIDMARGGEPNPLTPHTVPPALAAHDPAVVALRTAMQDLLIGEPPDSDLSRAVQLFCREGRGRGQTLEEVVGTIKRAWYALPETQYLPPGRFLTTLLDDLVRQTVEAY
jgi:hypothetical protein